MGRQKIYTKEEAKKRKLEQGRMYYYRNKEGFDRFDTNSDIIYQINKIQLKDPVYIEKYNNYCEKVGSKELMQT